MAYDKPPFRSALMAVLGCVPGSFHLNGSGFSPLYFLTEATGSWWCEGFWRELCVLLSGSTEPQCAKVSQSVLLIHLALCVSVTPRAAFGDVRCCRMLTCSCLTALGALHCFSGLERLRFSFFFFSFMGG